MPLRGGIRQRLGLGARAPERSRMGEFLVRKYGAGKLTAHEFAEGAHAAGSAAGDLVALRMPSLHRKRVRGGKLKPDTRWAARNASRILKKKSRLNSPLIVDLPQWDHQAGRKCMRGTAIFPIHETLDALVAPGEENDWTTFDSTQEQFKVWLDQWAARTGVELNGTSPWMCLSLWGDSAPYSKNDSLYLLTYRLLNGRHRERIWITALSARNLCACGCGGRHTIDGVFEVVAWSMRALLLGRWPEEDHRGSGNDIYPPPPCSRFRGEGRGGGG